MSIKVKLKVNRNENKCIRVRTRWLLLPGLLGYLWVGSSIAYGSQSDINCLALNDYWESRSETLIGRVAVANVVLNRTKLTGHSPCNVLQVARQFSWVLNVYNKTPLDKTQWEWSNKIARAMLDPEQRIKDPTYGALYYHHVDVSPKWAENMRTYITIGKHKFYFEVKEYP